MSNIYTEKEMMLAAMISNCRITEEIILLARSEFSLEKDEAPTFRQIVLACEAKDPPYDLWFREHEEGDVNNEAKFFEGAKTEDYGNWKIVGIYDDNDNSGFYGLAIETGEYTYNGVENGVIFSARGTEPTTLSQISLDLVMTDLDIINSDLTEQEKVMYGFLDNEFAQLLEEKGYSNLATSGHSLGGYLAFSAAAHMVYMRGYASQIFMQGTNIDGPGVTEENLADPVNQAIYAEINDRLTHYHYTFVGGLLTPICDNYISLNGASDWRMYGEEMDETKYQVLVSLYGQEIADKMAFLSYYISGQSGKHALASLQFTADGEYDIQYNERQEMVDIDTTPGIGSVMQGLVSGDYTSTVLDLSLTYATYYIYIKDLQDPSAVEYDVLANLFDKATELADEVQLLQIWGGGIVDLVCDLLNDLGDVATPAASVLGALTQKITPIIAEHTIMISKPAGSINMTSYFNIVDDIMALKDVVTTEEFAIDSKKLILETMQTISNLNCNVYGIAASTITYISETASECTMEIIEKVVDWDEAEKLVSAQKTFMLDWESHTREIENLSEEFLDDATSLCQNWSTYKAASLELVKEIV